MNAGIADATDLSWLIAAHLNGWAPADILDAHGAERWPITSQVSRFAMSHTEAEIAAAAHYPMSSRTQVRRMKPRGARWGVSLTRQNKIQSAFNPK